MPPLGSSKLQFVAPVVVCAVVVRSGGVGISTVFVLAADAALVDASGTFFNT